MIRANTAAEQAEALHLALYVDLLQAMRMHHQGTHQWMEVNGVSDATLHTRYVTDTGEPVVISRTLTLRTTHKPESPRTDAPVGPAALQ